MAFTKTIMIPLRARDSFFRDEFFSDCWEMMERQKKEFEQKCAKNLSSRESFGVGNKLLTSLDQRGSSSDEFLQYAPVSRRTRYHPASLMIMDSDHLARKFSSGLGIHSDRDNFKVSLDVQQFSPEELTVKTIDSTIVIEGKHEEKEDHHGIISRHFLRKYTLPSDVKVEQVQCNFTADGRLHITAPRHPVQQPPQLTSQNGTSAAEFEKMTYNKKSDTTTTSASPSATEPTGSKYTSMSDKFREEIKQAKDEFEKSTAELLTTRTERKDTFREEIKKAKEDFEKSTAGLLSRDHHDEFKHSRLLKMFEPHFTAFPEFDPLPFWKRGTNSTLLEEFDKKSSLFDEFVNSGRLGKTSILENSSNLTSPLNEVQGDRENFKVMLDVHEFKPEELNVKTYDYFVEIEAKHEAKEDPHGYITRHFKRKYTLPRDVKASDVQCNLSSEGILVVTAPRQKLEELAQNSQNVPIQQKESVQEVTSTRSTETQNKQHHNQSSAFLENKEKELDEHFIAMDIPRQEKVYQNVSTVHQVFTEKKEIPSTNENRQAELHKISIGQSQQNAGQKMTPGERVIPIDQESQSQSAGVRVEFPESRPESSASSIPFDFSRGKSEEPVSVASTIPSNFETPKLVPGERIIKIQVAN